MRPGDRLPLCVGAGSDQRFYSPDVQAGRSAVLLLGGSLRSAALYPLADALAAMGTALAALDTDLLVLGGFSAGPRAWQSGPGHARGVPVMVCNDGFFAACGLAPADGAVVVVDRAWRIVAAWDAHALAADEMRDAVLRTVEGVAREAPRDCVLPAPVLAIPDVFGPDLCADLMAHFEAGGSFDSGVSRIGPDGIACDRVDHARKHRRDCLLVPGDGTFETVQAALFRRCAPEIKRAFQHDITHTDRILVARYDDSGGYFRRHRDNMNEAVAFRQFAISVNLNAGAYEGGALMFPEFNDHRYAPATGGAVVFSTSVLHEAMPVTQGRRYVLLTFLHDAEAEQRRRLRVPELA